MKTLLIVGNGFDLNVGMPTDYRRFLKYYVGTSAGQNHSLVAKFKEMINEDIDKWSDVEVMLGKVTGKYSNATDFIAVYDDIREKLTRYLTAVDNLEYKALDTLSEVMAKDLLDFSGYFDPHQKRIWSEFAKNKKSDNPLTVDVMTFNYTSTMEKVKIRLEKMGTPVRIGNIYHIHRTLADGVMVGVNDKSQLNNSVFASIYNVAVRILKPFNNQEYDDGLADACLAAITSADVIILFGLSMGVTDNLWWRNIGDVIYKTGGKKVIYCPYDMENTKDCVKINVINNQFRSFVANQLIPDFGKSYVLKDVILPIRNNQLFKTGGTANILDVNFGEIMSWI